MPTNKWANLGFASTGQGSLAGDIFPGLLEACKQTENDLSSLA
jgi:hypothetical protein